MRLKRNLSVLTIVVGAFFMFAGSALANSKGQCSGPDFNAVNTTAGYLANLRQEGIESQAAQVAQFAGYRPVDGNFATWLNQRVLVAPLAQPATIDNNGCRNGRMFSAGKKHLPVGAPVLFALPNKYQKSDVRTSRPTGKGWKRITIMVRFVGQANCSNPGKAFVKVSLWVKVPVKAAPLPKPRPAPKPLPRPTPGPTAVCILDGVPQYVQPNGYIIGPNGVCVAVAVTTISCNGNQTPITNSAGVVINCINNTNTNTNTVIVPVTVIVNPPATVIVNPPATVVVTPPANRSPNVSLINPPQHVYSRGMVEICAQANDPDGNALTVSFSAMYGTTSSTYKPDPSGAPDKYCTRYTAPYNNGADISESIRVNVTDGLATASAQANFPIKKDVF